MKIELHTITVGALCAGFCDNEDEGVLAYGGHLIVRPAYQREFIYNPEQQREVVRTVMSGFPLNTMYWAKNGEAQYEIIDGQQRTMSICRYVAGGFTVPFQDDPKHPLTFANLSEERKKKVLDYGLQVYICEGSDDEKLSWFHTINIAGERLTDQELRNAVYSGPFVTAAKRYFAKSGCVAQKMGGDYVSGSPIRQELLERVLEWKAGAEGLTGNDRVAEYMARHRQDADAEELKSYFGSLIRWIANTFTTRRKEMKAVDWGPLYDSYHAEPIAASCLNAEVEAHLTEGHLDVAKLEATIKRLMQDSDVTRKAGIYTYVLTGLESALSIRAFDNNTRAAAYERQEGKCALCGKPCKREELEADHITPWSRGGRTVDDNCQLLCRECNRKKGAKP